MLRDPKFRQALQYAVDRQTNARIAYDGYLSPGGTLLPPYSAYAWQPPSDQAYTYDPAKAKAMLAAAGYKDVNGDGYVEDRNGKPLTLRLYTDAQTPPNITTSKLLVGWLRTLGCGCTCRSSTPGRLRRTKPTSWVTPLRRTSTWSSGGGRATPKARSSS